jgi:hypothetical protein
MKVDRTRKASAANMVSAAKKALEVAYPFDMALSALPALSRALVLSSVYIDHQTCSYQFNDESLASYRFLKAA